jgi:hypothetical protein
MYCRQSGLIIPYLWKECHYSQIPQNTVREKICAQKTIHNQTDYFPLNSYFNSCFRVKRFSFVRKFNTRIHYTFSKPEKLKKRGGANLMLVPF